MTYDPTLAKDTDKVRYLVGDTDDDDLMLEDTEIKFLLTLENDNLFEAAARACETIAAKFARDVNYRFSTMWQDASDAYDHYMRLAKRLRERDEYHFPDLGFKASPVFDDRNEDYGPEVFWVAMHDNPPTPQDPDDS